VKGCNLSSGRFSYTTIGQSVKQRNSEGNALRTREIILRSPISIPLRFTAESGGSFRATPWHLHSEEQIGGELSYGEPRSKNVATFRGGIRSKYKRAAWRLELDAQAFGRDCASLAFSVVATKGKNCLTWRHNLR
jgi:hypothetical protein